MLGSFTCAQTHLASSQLRSDLLVNKGAAELIYVASVMIHQAVW